MTSETESSPRCPTVAEFAEEARSWFEEQWTFWDERTDDPSGKRELLDVAVFNDMSHEEERAYVAKIASWIQLKATRGYHAVDWPPRFGGLGLSRAHAQALRAIEREFAAPASHELIGVSTALVSNTIAALGGEELRDRFVSGLLRAEVLACQLFSEPGAGSDLAALSCRAIRDGDEWVVNGQKVWTSGAQFSDWGELIARTDPDGAKHAGMTAFMVDMRSPGVEVRPIRQMTGGASFCEVFLTDVRIPDQLRIGEVGDGWNVATTTLSFERDHSQTISDESVGGGSWHQLYDTAQRMGRTTDPVVRDKLAGLFIAQRIEELTNRRAADLNRKGTPGPEGSIGKLLWTDRLTAIGELAVELIGAKALADTGEFATFEWDAHLLGAPGYRIAGGSDEVQKNIIGERVLGLPREPSVDRSASKSKAQGA